MPPSVCDRPPRSPAEIAMRVNEQAIPFGVGTGWTIQVPSMAIRAEAKRQVTNRSPNLSISRARLQSLASEAHTEVEGYSRFSRGWDGYSGEPIAAIAIEAANALISALSRMRAAELRLLDIIPGPAPDGSLDLELRTASRRLIITIYAGVPPEEYEIRTFRTDGSASEEKNDLGADALVGDLRWLLA